MRDPYSLLRILAACNGFGWVVQRGIYGLLGNAVFHALTGCAVNHSVAQALGAVA